MSEITVEKRLNKPVWVVKVEGRVFGEIRFTMENGKPVHQYFPKGSSQGGGKFESLNACIRSLHGD